MIKVYLILIFLLSADINKFVCQTTDDAELRKTEYLGRMLYEYDLACWIASDSLMAVKPDESLLGAFAAYKEDSIWKVGFGKLSQDSSHFLLYYEAVYNPVKNTCPVYVYTNPVINRSVYYHSAKGLKKILRLVSAQFPPYNYAVIPAEDSTLYFYFYPALKDNEHYRLGGDYRFSYNTSSEIITDSLKLHKSILNMPYIIKENQNISGTISTAVITTHPVETDILYVLTRKFRAAHYVMAGEWVFIISADGKIIRMTKETFKNLGR